MTEDHASGDDAQADEDVEEESVDEGDDDGAAGGGVELRRRVCFSLS